MACAYIAVTFFMSSITSELIDSFLLSAATLLLLTLAGYVTSAYVMVFPDWLGWLKIFLNEISLSTHFANFSKGVIHSKDVVYYLGVALVFFYCNIKALESKKWS
jgi:ABC-2 type transport system permease protein